MCLAWLNVIIHEKLYDRGFVRRWTVGFEDLQERVRQYPPERVAQITGVPAEDIRKAARMYAAARSAVIPWTPITDKQVSSTSAIRCHAILRAICGHLDVPGGDVFHGPIPQLMPEEDIELHDLLPEEQRQKQLGAEEHPIYTHRVAAMLEDATERVWGQRYLNLVQGNYMANPSVTFRAMETGDPYPVRAFFAVGNNALMAYPNQQRIRRAMLAQDLLVAHDLFMTPTAALCDWVLPSDSFGALWSALLGVYSASRNVQSSAYRCDRRLGL